MLIMTKMSRAILGVLDGHASDISLLSDKELTDAHKILTAFTYDLRREIEIRGIEVPRVEV